MVIYVLKINIFDFILHLYHLKIALSVSNNESDSSNTLFCYGNPAEGIDIGFDYLIHCISRCTHMF